MLKNLLIILFAFGQMALANAQSDPVYFWDWKTDGIVLGTSGLLYGGSFWLRDKADKVTLEGLNQLHGDNIWALDRGAINNYSPAAAKASDYFLYGGLVFTMVNYVHPKGRKEGWVIAGMALESYLISEGLTNILKATTKRHRPFVYNPEVSDEEKLSASSRLSFPSGHTSASAMASFFTAKVYSDLYPNSKWKPLIWGLATAIPLTTGYLRYQAGKHFPTDIITGYAIGAAVGYLVPHFHKISNEKVSYQLIPVSQGLVFSYQRRF